MLRIIIFKVIKTKAITTRTTIVIHLIAKLVLATNTFTNRTLARTPAPLAAD